MATQRKKPTKRTDKTVKDNSFSKLDEYCIWLNEYYNSLRKAGFDSATSMTLIMDKESYPDWVSWKRPTDAQIADYMDEEDED